MSTSSNLAASDPPSLTNGSGAAAVLSAGIGSFALAVLSVAADKSALIKSTLIFYKPTGPLSGVTTAAILFWFFTWGILEWRWRKKTLAMGPISFAALTLLAVSLLLTFPPIADLL
jgi:hypothetical protein